MFRPAPLALTVTALLTAGCANHPWSTKDHQPATKDSVVDHYADLAHANYEDALITARALDEATDRLIANPTEANLATAKKPGWQLGFLISKQKCSGSAMLLSMTGKAS